MKEVCYNSTADTTPSSLKHLVTDIPDDEGCMYTTKCKVLMEKGGM